MRDGFSEYHPLVNFAYFASVILFSMFLMHPVCLIISLAASFAYSVCLRGTAGVRLTLYMLPVIAAVMLINPAFNHGGTTVIAYLPSGNPLTLESVIYGAAAAMLTAVVIQWFYCFTAVITSDKVIYLFGRVIPALSLVLSMTIRFVPRFAAHLRAVRDARRCAGNYPSGASAVQRLKAEAKILSATVSWAMENAIDTADSMKGRGYGLGGRTAFSVYRFTRRDAAALAVIFLLAAYSAAGAFLGYMDFTYFPSVSAIRVNFYSATVLCAYFILCFIPAAAHVKEALKWKHYLSKI